MKKGRRMSVKGIRCIILLCVLWFAVLQVLGQSVHYEVKWQSNAPVVNLDSLGRDYQFVGGDRTSEGVIVHRGVEVWRAGTGAVEITALEYAPLPFSVTSYPVWLKTIYVPEAEVVNARGELLLRTAIPAFRYENGELRCLKGYSVQVKSKSTPTRTTRQAVVSDYTQVTHSVLATGHWQKISVQSSGVYKIEYNELVDRGFADPANLSVWGGHPFQLPYENATPNVDDLQPIPIEWVTRTGQPQAGDYALVFLDGASWWTYNNVRGMYDYHEHDYDSVSHYFVTTDRLPTTLQVKSTPVPTQRQTDYLGMWGYRGHTTNLRYSGREFFGFQFEFRLEHKLRTALRNCVLGSSAKIYTRVAATSPTQSTFTVSIAGKALGEIDVPPCPSSSSDLAKISEQQFTFPVSSSELDVDLRYQRPSYAATGWLSRLWVNARQEFPAQLTQILFFSDHVAAAVGRQGFSFPDYDADEVELWDVTDRFKSFRYASLAEASANADTPARMVLFSRDAAKGVAWGATVANQNLHGAAVPELLIVAHERFLSHAEAIADIYRHSALSHVKNIAVVSTQQIYNEFASGNMDVSAIRNYSRFLYWRGGGSSGSYRYLLLVGKPFYNLRKRHDDLNLVPNYQSENSINNDLSFGSDDIFGFLDPTETAEHGELDIGIGRYAVHKTEQADELIRHEQSYHTMSNWGAWLTNVVMLADDEDGLAYMRGSDSMAVRIEKERKDILIKRLYVDAFRQDNSWGKAHYSAVSKELNQTMNRGAFLLNYVGHGSTHRLGHEYFFTFDDAKSWRNMRTLPILVAASCFFASADWEGDFPLGQSMLFMPQGGSIALIAASRLTFNYSNQIFNAHLLRSIFPSTASPQHRALGDALRVSKNKTPGSENRSKYLLLGNPILPLPNFSAKAKVVTLNGQPLRGMNDTIRAGEQVSLGVTVQYPDATPFTGELTLQLFGPKRKVRTLNNDGDGVFEYQERVNTIFRGKASVRDGEAQLNFIVPTDMELNYDTGLVSILASSDEALASGAYDDFVVGGRTTQATTDTEGPEMEISWNDYAQRPHAVVSSNALLIIRLRDSSGINISGAGAGHDLLATLSGGGKEERIVLNDFYTAEKDSHQRGEVRYHFTNLRAGKYTLKVDAFDVYNNQSSRTLSFEVGEPKRAQIANLLNYPNPFTESTSFYFDSTRPGQAVEVMIQIYTPDGILVRTLHFSDPAPSSRLGPFFWDGKDEWGNTIGRGVYFYRVRLRYRENWIEAGATTEIFEKLLKL